MRSTAFAVFLALLPIACGPSVRPPGEKLASLVDEYWKHEIEEDVSSRANLGLPVEHLPDISFAHAQQEAERARQMLAKLERVDAAPLTEEERITLAILKYLHQQTVDRVPHFWLQSQVAPYSSPIRGINQIFSQLPVATAEDRARYLRLLDEHAQFVDQVTEIVKEQQKRGVLLPKPEIPIARTLFHTSALVREDSGQESFAAQVKEKVAAKNEAAIQRLAAVFTPEYEAAAPAGVGLGQYPGGPEAYRMFVRTHTGTNLTPEEIHQLGLREVERINGEMAEVRKRLGFNGTKAEFHQLLRTDPRFFAKTPEEVGERLMAQVHRIEPHIDRLFSVKPRAAYGVARLAPAIEPAMTFGYYQEPTKAVQKGTYLYNGSKLNERNLLFAPALMAHELVPGHHFQVARQLENESIPQFRRMRWDTAFGEGWGEYSAYLGNEIGLYEDPYDRYGRLMMDMLLSTRLVVDTGMNALGWSRERAMEFMKENTLLGDTEVATESLRYSVDMPGQALAYKIGSLKMIELRRRAERELGEKFDVRQFHEWVIGSGTMPLAVLEEHVERQLHRTKQP